MRARAGRGDRRRSSTGASSSTGVFVNAPLDEVAETGGRVPLLAAPAPRRRGPGVLRRGRAPHRLPRDQGRARARRGQRPGAARLPHRLPPARRALAEGAAAAPGRPSTGSSPGQHPGTPPVDPVRRADARTTSAEAIAAARPFARGHGERHRGRAGPQGPGQADGVLPRGRGTPTHVARMSAPPVERRFGPYGGRYVPETLDPRARRARGARGSAARADPAFARELDALLRDYVGRPTPLYLAARLSELAGGDGLAEARGPDAHRLAQDQQRARPGAAREADGQAARDRRDRRRPARRGGRHRVRAARPRVRRLHGHRGHAPPASRTCSGCGCSAPRSRGVDAGARTLKEAVSARRSATGSRTSRPRTT